MPATFTILESPWELQNAAVEACCHSFNVGNLLLQEEAQLVRAVVRFMLFRQAQKPGVPVKREELSKLILSNYANQRMTPRLTGYILRKADAKFVEAFGMEMAEISTKVQGRQGEPLLPSFLLAADLLREDMVGAHAPILKRESFISHDAPPSGTLSSNDFENTGWNIQRG